LDEELLALIDRLEAVLAGSGLEEIEVEAGGTSLRLRRRGTGGPGGAGDREELPIHDALTSAAEVPEAADAPDQAAHHQVLAPLTGLFYTAPTPEAEPYVSPGAEVEAGQVIGLIEAMKLFNEIKSDVRGRVVRVLAENGQLIKARQPLIEVEAA
jgi:acetyl-CoA carboxylase biotin carboxyl carrier protein